MKLAVLADVHANLEALEAVLADLGGWPDLIVVAGDLIGYGPDPNEVVSRLRMAGARCVWGNHEGMVLGRLGMKNCIYAGIRAALWTRKVLTPENRAWLEALPCGMDVAQGVYMTHADPRDVERYVDDASQAGEALAAAPQKVRLLIVGHTHRAVLSDGHTWVRPGKEPFSIDKKTLLNPGAVGQSRDKQALARYARVDLEANVATFHEVGYPWQLTSGKMKRAGLVPLLVAPSHGLPTRLVHALLTRWLRWSSS